MKLNKLEATFFKQVLNAELGVPVHATLEYKGDTFEVILVPELNEDGQFLFKYYNAPEYEPETQFDEEGLGTKTFKDDQILGRHPSLKRAWLTGDPVTLQMRPSCLPISAVRSQELRAAVLYAGRHHKGLVGLERNQVTLEQSPLQRAEFSLVGLPDFVLPNRSVHSTIDLSAQERETLQSLADRLGDNASIDIKPSSRDITLNSGNGWTIRLIRDEQQNRDMVGHTGLIERADAQLFESDELGKVLDVLKHFLAFVVGEYCQPTVIVGYDPQNRPVWGEVGQFSTSPHHVSNWFNNSSTVFLSTALEDLFPMFWSMWLCHKDEMVAVLECYVHSNAMRQAGVPKDAVAKSFAGLEILASLARGKTIGGNASEGVHETLSCYKIPNLCLDQNKTPVMARLSTKLGESALSGVYLLGSVRNYVAHPLDTDTQAKIKQGHLDHLDGDSDTYFFLHDLSQYYLEYALLKFLGFEVGDNHRQLLEALQQP